ncbi:hypothetical protein JCM18750_38490 [Halostagnicola bangensis]
MGEGGSFDSYARAIAPEWEERFDGDVDIEVENVTGAGGIVGTEELYNAEPDGYSVGFLNVPGINFSEAFRDVNYVVEEFEPLARLTTESWVLNASANREPDTWEDLVGSDMSWGSTGIGGTMFFLTAILADAMDAEADIIPGYDPLPETLTAIMQEEIDVTITSRPHPLELVEDGEIDILLAFADDHEEVMEGYDGAITEEIEEFEGFTALNSSRIIGTPPGTPDDIVSTLEETLWETIQSEEIQEWSEESEWPITNPAEASESADAIAESNEAIQEYSDVIEQYMDEHEE